MKKDKVVTDKFCQEAFDELLASGIAFGDGGYKIFPSDILSDYLENHRVPKDFIKMSAPSVQQLTSIFKNRKAFKDHINALIDEAVSDFIETFESNKEYFEAEADAEAEATKWEAEEEAKQTAKRKKLLKNFSEEQLALLKENFNITV